MKILDFSKSLLYSGSRNFTNFWNSRISKCTGPIYSSRSLHFCCLFYDIFSPNPSNPTKRTHENRDFRFWRPGIIENHENPLKIMKSHWKIWKKLISRKHRWLQEAVTLRIFGVRELQNILGTSTRRDLFISGVYFLMFSLWTLRNRPNVHTKTGIFVLAGRHWKSWQTIENHQNPKNPVFVCTFGRFRMDQSEKFKQ